MRLKSAAVIATVVVIIVGFSMITPLFFREDKVDNRVMLVFSVTEPEGASEWCSNLSSILNTYDMPATVFVVGKIAQQYPHTVTCFSDKVDIGSRTFTNLNLHTIDDYTKKLEEVQEGKSAVNQAGDIDSKVFQAPNGATDQDIFSLLNRSGILADFSYDDHYNVYENGQFVKYPSVVFDAQKYSANFFIHRAKTLEPTIIRFNSTCSTSNIQSYLAILESGDFDFVNASQLAGITLTQREA